MAVTVFELVSVLRFTLWVFTAVLTIFQLIVLLREQVQSVFFTETAVIVLWDTMLFPGRRQMCDWLVYSKEDCLSGTSPSAGRRCYRKFYWENYKPASLFRSIQSINAALFIWFAEKIKVLVYHCFSSSLSGSVFQSATLLFWLSLSPLINMHPDKSGSCFLWKSSDEPIIN